VRAPRVKVKRRRWIIAKLLNMSGESEEMEKGERRLEGGEGRERCGEA
jgi:hypothetical protein